MKRISACNVPEDENNLVQTRLGGEFWASDVIMHKAHSCLIGSSVILKTKQNQTKNMGTAKLVPITYPVKFRLCRLLCTNKCEYTKSRI